MKNCSRCEELPQGEYDSGILYISPPLGHTFEKVRNLFEQNNLTIRQPFDQILGIDLDQITVSHLARKLEEQLEEFEIEDTKSLHNEDDQEPSVADLARMKPLSQFLGEARGQWIGEAIRNDRFFSMFQPIVHLDDSDQFPIFGYECLLRAHQKDDGGIISPARIFTDAKRANMIFLLDRHARITSIAEAAEHDITEKIFINFLPTSIYDPDYCLRTTVEALKDTPIENEQIVFEVVETESIQKRDQLTEILEYYREKSFGVALDDMGAGYSSLGLLKDLKPDYMKIDFELVNGVSQDSYKADIARSLIEISHKHNIQVIAEGIESASDMKWFRENGADLGQGFFFARPDTPPPLPGPVAEGV